MTDDVLDHSRRKFFYFGAAALFASLTTSHAMAQSVSNKLKIGVIGSGHIGGTIGGLWVKAGHSVLFSSRHPEELKPLTDSLGPLAKAGTVGDALDFGDVILVAVPYKAIPELAKDYGPKFAGKIVIDPANAVARRDGEDLLKETKEKGIGATTESYLKGSHVVRAFNSMSYTNPLRATTSARSRSPRSWCAMQVSSRWQCPLPGRRSSRRAAPFMASSSPARLCASASVSPNDGIRCRRRHGVQQPVSSPPSPPDKCDTSRASCARLVLVLHFLGPCLVLHPASDPRSDGRGRRGE